MTKRKRKQKRKEKKKKKEIVNGKNSGYPPR